MAAGWKLATDLPPGEQKDKFKQLFREQAAELSPEMKERMEQRAKVWKQIEDAGLDECGEHEVRQPGEKIIQGKVEYPEKELEEVKRLTPEDLRKLAKAMEAGPGAAKESLKETANEILVRTGESTRDSMLAGIKLVVGLLEYDRDLVLNPERARENAGKAGEGLAIVLVAGIEISAGSVGYVAGVRKSGDYSLPLKHISVGLNSWYEKQSPADQMAIVSELCAWFGIGAGAAEANKLRKPGAFVAFLKEGLESLPRNPEAERKAIEAISKLLRRAEPVADTGVGAAVKGSDVVKEAQEKSITDHIMEMVQFLPEHGKEILRDRKLRQEYGLTKKDLMKMTEAELAALRIERIEASYRTVFYRAHRQLKGTGLAIHHALPQSLRDRYPWLFKAKEVHSLKYLNGIPKTATVNGEWVHDLMTSLQRVGSNARSRGRSVESVGFSSSRGN